MPAAPILDLHVELHYRLERPEPILAEVSWRIDAGQHWAVVGENGSGKSTLLSIVSGELWPSRGTVRVLGQEYGRCDKRELRKRIGIVSPAAQGGFPAGDLAVEVAASGIQATYGLLSKPGPEDRERARRALSRVGAEPLLSRPYGVLSQGERQRVMIARALISEPRLLVLDEPCSGLDPVARERFLSDLTALSAEQSAPTQIHVTHHLDEIPGFVTHALLLRGGRVVAAGSADDVLTPARLGETFGVGCEVERRGTGAGRRFFLRVAPV